MRPCNCFLIYRALKASKKSDVIEKIKEIQTKFKEINNDFLKTLHILDLFLLFGDEDRRSMYKICLVGSFSIYDQLNYIL